MNEYINEIGNNLFSSHVIIDASRDWWALIFFVSFHHLSLDYPTGPENGAAHNQTCINSRNTRIPPGFFKFQKLNFLQVPTDGRQFLVSIWQYQIQPLPLCDGLDLLSSRYM